MSTLAILIAGAILMLCAVGGPLLIVHCVAEWWFARKREPEPLPPTRPGRTERGDTFMCPACGSGPWHRDWGRYCPNCTGAD